MMEYPYELRPKWYWQRPSDRTRRIIERLSRGRVISGQPLLDLAQRIARKVTGRAATNVVNAVCSWTTAVANGKWVSMSREYIYLGRSFIRLNIVKPTGRTCRWCGTSLFNINHYRCNSRLCRELSAVAARRHKTIRIRLSYRSDPEMRELEKAKFIATFYIRKLKEKKNAISLP
jgi:hypothetical protein